MYDVVAFGEVLIDFAKVGSSDGFPVMAARPGGAPANCLAALSNFKKRVAFIGKVGKDQFGELLKNSLEEFKIDTSNLLIDDEYFTTLAFVDIDESGDRKFSFARKPGADTQIKMSEIDLSMIDNTKIFHFGTLSMCKEPALSTTMRLVEYAKEKGKLISFDPNLRELLWEDLNEAKKAFEYGFKHANIVKISLEEAQFFFGKGKTAQDYAKEMIDTFNTDLVFVTCDKDGVYAKTKNIEGHYKAHPYIKPVDTTGAGDIFMGSALSVLLNINIPIKALTEVELNDICTFANIAAGLSTQEIGGMSSVPSLDYVLRELEIIKNL